MKPKFSKPTKSINNEPIVIVTANQYLRDKRSRRAKALWRKFAYSNMTIGEDGNAYPVGLSEDDRELWNEYHRRET